MSRRILTLVDAFSQKAFIIMSIGKCIFKLQFKARSPNFHVELILLHSPLLKESCLVSHPPLTYMLKFSGFSCLTSGLKQKSAPGGTQNTQHSHREQTKTQGQARTESLLLSAMCKYLCTMCVKTCFNTPTLQSRFGPE